MEKALTVYHGSKNGLEGPVRMVAGRNRLTCDFGQGFYMGDEPTQPRTLICDGTRPTLYTLSLDLDGLKVHRFKTDADWALFIAYNRGFLEELVAETGLKHGRARKSLPPEHLFWVGYLYRYWHCLTGETSAAIYATSDYRTMAGTYAGYHTLSCELAIDNLKEDAKAA